MKNPQDMISRGLNWNKGFGELSNSISILSTKITANVNTFIPIPQKNSDIFSRGLKPALNNPYWRAYEKVTEGTRNLSIVRTNALRRAPAMLNLIRHQIDGKLANYLLFITILLGAVGTATR